VLRKGNTGEETREGRRKTSEERDNKSFYHSLVGRRDFHVADLAVTSESGPTSKR